MTDYIEQRIEIVNARGLHARAAAKLVKLVELFDGSELRVIKDDMDVVGTSIMGLLMLAASKGTFVTLRASGDRAEEMIAAVSDLINRKFGEEN
jgi:phosphocarrier protein HPr